METPEIANMPLHEEIKFFEPLLENIRKILDLLEKKNGNKIKDNLDCFYAPSSGGKRPWKEMYLISSEWEPVRHYLMRKANLLYYYEPPMRGLVNKDATFWIFPNIEQLQQLAYRDRFKINELKPEGVKKIPFQNLEQHFQKQISELLHDQSKVYSIRTQECERYLKLTSAYMKKKQATEVIHLARVMLKVGLHDEIVDLIRVIEEKVLVDAKIMRKRLRAIHTLTMRYYFFNAPDEEKKKIDSLIGRDTGSVLKSLKYVERKVGRSFDIAREKKSLVNRQ